MALDQLDGADAGWWPGAARPRGPARTDGLRAGARRTAPQRVAHRRVRGPLCGMRGMMREWLRDSGCAWRRRAGTASHEARVPGGGVAADASRRRRCMASMVAPAQPSASRRPQRRGRARRPGRPAATAMASSRRATARYSSQGTGGEPLQRREVAADRAHVAAHEGSGQRRGDAQALGVGEGLADERGVDGERAGLVEPGAAPDLGDGVEQAHEAARGEHRRRVVGRLAAGRQAHRLGAEVRRPARPAAPASRRRPRARWSRRAARRARARGRRRRPAGGTSPRCVPAARAGREDVRPERAAGVDDRLARRRGAAGPRRPAMASSGTVRKTRSTSSAMAAAMGDDAGARAPARGSAPGGPASRLATATTGQPARAKATPSAVPTRPAPTKPMRGWPLGSSGRMRVAMPGRRDRPIVVVRRVVAACGRARRARSSAARPAAYPSGSAGVYSRHRPNDLDPRRAHPSGADPSRARRGPVEARPWHSIRSTSTRFDARARLRVGDRELTHLPPRRGRRSRPRPRCPFTVKVLLENVLRHAGGGIATADDVRALAAWRPGGAGDAEVPFMPGRVLLQDFTGVPAVVDLAAMRDAMAQLGGDPARINPLVPVDLVIDHSVQVDRFGTADAFAFNVEPRVRAQPRALPVPALGPDGASRNFRVVPPGTGIVHQVNLEYLADRGAQPARGRGRRAGGLPRHARRHRLAHHHDQRPGRAGLGRRRHRGRGGACSASRSTMPLPRVVGVRLHGALPRGRHRHRPGPRRHPDAAHARRGGQVRRVLRATAWPRWPWPTAPRSPTWRPSTAPPTALFPVDERDAGLPAPDRPRRRSWSRWSRPTPRRRACSAQPGADPEFDETLELDLGTRRAQPGRARDGRRTGSPWANLQRQLPRRLAHRPATTATACRQRWRGGGRRRTAQTRAIGHGAVVIAAITSCTNTSNPSVMVAAGPAGAEGGRAGPASVAPAGQDQPGARLAGGDRATCSGAGLLRAAGASWASTWSGYGCTTCIGNSGPLPEPIASAIEDNDLVVAAVLSGNRNFEGRITRSSRPTTWPRRPLVVAYALAGTVDIDLTSRAARHRHGRPAGVPARTSGPRPRRSQAAVRRGVTPGAVPARATRACSRATSAWRAMPVPRRRPLYAWDPTSTYIASRPSSTA